MTLFLVKFSRRNLISYCRNKLHFVDLRIEGTVREFRIVSDYHKAIAQRQQLDGQLSENTGVKKVCDNYNSWSKLLGNLLFAQPVKIFPNFCGI
jgi:hypothetical protein